jgi:hypothetical protein
MRRSLSSSLTVPGVSVVFVFSVELSYLSTFKLALDFCSFDARVEAAVAEALASRLASSAAGGSAANAIDVN